jgi:dinuclear metal center YbgI/SA1388 family protein
MLYCRTLLFLVVLGVFLMNMATKQKFSIQEITNYLEEIAPIEWQEGYDNSGLLIGDSKKKVSNILFCLDCTEAVLAEAKKLNCGLVIAHHPIIFKGLKKINTDHYVDRIVTYAIKNDIAIYASHTNMDNTMAGVNFQIAKKLGLQNIRPLVPKEKQLYKLYTYVPVKYLSKVKKALFEAGAGEIGDYKNCSFETQGQGSFRPVGNANPHTGSKDILNKVQETKIEFLLWAHQTSKVVKALKKAHPYEEVAYELITLENSQDTVGSGLIGELDKPMKHRSLLSFLSKKMKAKGIRYTVSDKKEYQKIAVCGGSGAFLTKKAIRADADAYITGDVKYHEFFEADNRLSLIDIGHYESEQYTPRLFYDILSKKMPTFALHLSKINTNPIKYF